MCGSHRRLGRDQAEGWSQRSEPSGASDAEADASDAPKVLLESGDGAEAHALWRLLRRNGYDVSWCPGPRAHDARGCPLVESGHCDLVDEADVVLCSLNLADPSTRQVLEAHHRHEPARTVLVAAPRPLADRYADVIDGSDVVAVPLTGEGVVEAVEEHRARGAGVPPRRS